MGLRDLLNISTSSLQKRERGAVRPTSDDGGAKGAFLTGQSIVTFPGATMAITIIWEVIGNLMPEWDNSMWLPFIISFLVGAFIYYIGVSDPRADRSLRALVIATGVALVNTMYLFAAVTGIGALSAG